MDKLERLLERWSEGRNEDGKPLLPKLTMGILIDAHNMGINQRELADALQITEQWVSKFRYTYGPGWQTPRELAKQTFPWSVPAQFQQTYLHKMMRNHAEFMATGGKGMAKYKLDKLRGFYKRLERQNLVVEFDPGIQPSRSVQTGGWRLTPRLESDGELIIRVNEYTNLTPVSEVIYRFPPALP